MDKKIINELETLKGDIFSDPLIIHYLELKKIISSSKELLMLEEKMKSLKKCKMTKEEKNEYQNTLNIYNTNPLIAEFKTFSDDVYSYLIEIKSDLEL
jgi:hypothetical protein